MRRIVVVGAGLAGFHAAQTLRREGFEGELTVVGDEPVGPYDRPPLSKQLLAGTMDVPACALGHEAVDATWRLGSAATGLRPADRVVELDDGRELAYDGLVIATGRRARAMAVPDLAGIVTLRAIADAQRLREATAGAREIVIVGAGFIGCEVAATLRCAGAASITLIDVAQFPIPVLGAEAAGRARRLHEEHGVRFRLGAHVSRFEGADRVQNVALDDGTRIAADVVLVAIGSTPNTEWLAGSGLLLHRGCVRCDERCFADGVEDVVAVGDAAAWPHPQAGGLLAIEHWTNARDMARAGAANLLAGRLAATPYEPIPSFWSDQYDVKIKSLGFLGLATSFSVVEEDVERRRLVVEASRDGELVGVVLFNRNRALVEYQRRLRAVGASI